MQVMVQCKIKCCGCPVRQILPVLRKDGRTPRLRFISLTVWLQSGACGKGATRWSSTRRRRWKTCGTFRKRRGCGMGRGPASSGQPRGSLISAGIAFRPGRPPFDFLEPGVEMIAGLARNLRRGQVESALCISRPRSVRPHRLPLHDPRPGRWTPGCLLSPASPHRRRPRRRPTTSWSLRPVALGALLIARDGSVRHLNAAALLLLGAGQRASLSACGRRGAGRGCSPVSRAGTIVITRSSPMRLGERDIRLTLRLLGRAPGHNAFAFLFLDDVTSGGRWNASSLAPPAQHGGKPSETGVDADAHRPGPCHPRMPKPSRSSARR